MAETKNGGAESDGGGAAVIALPCSGPGVAGDLVALEFEKGRSIGQLVVLGTAVLILAALYLFRML